MSDAASQPTSWNGMALPQGVNRRALAWAWQQGPRLLDLGMNGSERDALMAIAALGRLEEAGIISRDARPPKSARYRITPEGGGHTWTAIVRKADSPESGW